MAPVVPTYSSLHVPTPPKPPPFSAQPNYDAYVNDGVVLGSLLCLVFDCCQYPNMEEGRLWSSHHMC